MKKERRHKCGFEYIFFSKFDATVLEFDVDIL